MLVVSIIASVVHGQPTQYATIPPNSTDFTGIGNLVYFRVDDQLWRTDGTANGTFLLQDLNVQRLPSLTRFRGMVFFAVGNDLWRTDGTQRGTIVLKSSSEGSPGISDTTSQYLFFGAADSGTGYELYRTDGTVGGTSLVRDINPGAASGFKGYGGAVGDELFFAGDDGAHGTELWKTSGSAASTVMVKDINTGSGDGFARVANPSHVGRGEPYKAYFATADKFYFVGYTAATGNEPWTSDGSAAGTVLLSDLTPGSEGTAYIFYEIDLNGDLFFITKPPRDKWELEESTSDLWKTQGSPGSAVKLRIVGSASEEFESPFRILGDRILFFFRTPDSGNRLMVSDGTPAGTKYIFSINDYAGMEGPLPFEDIVNGHLLFYAIHDGAPTPFFRNDGTAESTEIFARFACGAYLKYPRDVAKVGDLVFYGDHDGPASEGDAENPEDHFQLMQSDGFTTQSVRDIEGGSYSGTFEVVDFNGKLIFTTYDENAQPSPTVKKLWIYDPNVQPTTYFTLVDADSDQDIQRLHEGDTVRKAPEKNINITYTPAETVGSVVFKVNDVTTRKESAAPYSLAGDVNGDYAPWQGAQPGTYTLTATPYSEPGGQGMPGESLTIHFTIQDAEPTPSECTASGTILREYWDNVSGNTVSSIPTGTTPTSTSQLTIFEGPTNSDTNYGARISGYICPPATGVYTFWIASNDNSELWLSTDDTRSNKRRIAYVTGATDPRQWDKFPSQKSTGITLSAGHRYYVEVLHKQGVGTDNVAVGWQLPDGTFERPISGSRLSPATDGGNQPPFIQIASPENGQTYHAPATVMIEAEPSDEDGTVSKVEFFWGRPDNTDRTKLGEDATAPYTFTWSDVPAGKYVVYARAHDDEGATSGYDFIVITVTEECTASGRIAREYWTGIQGNNVSDIPVNTTPDGSSLLAIFEGPPDWGTNYGARIRGYICPPATGDYTFWISSNDHSELWLSSDDDPAHKTRIAYLERATGYRQWNAFSTQRSKVIALVQGKRYYIEALHKEGIGSDHVSVGWQLPDGTLERPIGGNRLSPFEMSVEPSAFAAAADAGLYSQIDIYPNPAQSGDPELTVSGFGGIDQTIETDVSIIDMTGNVVFKDRIECGGDCSSYLMTMNNELVPGLYLVNLKTNGVRRSKRLLVK